METIKPRAGGIIDEKVRIRDRHQFEIKLGYPLAPDGGTITYELAAYIFIPSSLGMHRGNYSKSSFYEDLQTLTRIKTPACSLEGMVCGPQSPLFRLEASTRQLEENDTREAVAAFEHQIKLFCCILQSALRDFATFVGDTVDPEDRSRLVQQYLEATRAITDSFRGLRLRIFQPPVQREASVIYSFGDEYVSLLIERSGYELAQLLHPDEVELRGEVLKRIGQELRYRERRRYPSIPDEDSDNEGLIFRRNVLKKYMHNVLFLDTEKKKEGAMIEQGLFAIAAGISMLFATVILFFWQSRYGPLTLPVFLALVIGYMFKDRIKELLRAYFSQKVSGILFDHKTRIYSDPDHPIGHCRESCDFLDENKVPDYIMKIRDRSHLTEIESDWVTENIVRYRKQIKLSSRAISAAYRDLDTRGIIDIMRFNVAEITRRMGNPRKELFVLKDGDFEKIKAERVYHLNMILRYGREKQFRSERLRIVLNRRGIKRIETISVDND